MEKCNFRKFFETSIAIIKDCSLKVSSMDKIIYTADEMKEGDYNLLTIRVEEKIFILIDKFYVEKKIAPKGWPKSHFKVIYIYYERTVLVR